VNLYKVATNNCKKEFGSAFTIWLCCMLQQLTNFQIWPNPIRC